MEMSTIFHTEQRFIRFSMMDTEINESVARKLGWKECQCAPEVRDEHRRYMPSKHIMPNYCGNIAAAWEVVEYLSKHYFSVSVSHDDERDLWQCAYEIREDPAIFATADTAPMAICEAFLKMP